VLEDLGWSIHRIWSSDWFSRPESELRRALEAIEHARLGSGRSPSPTAEPAPQPVVDIARTGEQEAIRAVELQGVHYQIASLTIRLNGVELHEVATDRMAHWVASVAEVEGPVHIDDVARRVALAAGLQRVGNRIESAIGRAISAAERNGAVRRVGAFIWHKNANEPVVRNRSNLEASARRIDRIAPEEIGLAVKTIVEASHGINLAELHVAVCRMFGLQRTTDEMVDVIRQVTLDLCHSGTLAVENEHVTIKA
jgi:hypothetical protein